MNLEPKFNDKNTQRIWDDYFDRVRKIIRHLSAKHKSEIQLELKSHLYESFQAKTSENEVENLLDAIDHLGKPEDFLKPMVSQKLLASGNKSLNPVELFTGIFYGLFTSVKRGLLMMAFGLGYLTTFLLGALSFLKIFFPEQVGLFVNPNGRSFTLGFSDNVSESTEILGYWIIPLGVLASFMLYYLLSKLLSRFVQKIK